MDYQDPKTDELLTEEIPFPDDIEAEELAPGNVKKKKKHFFLKILLTLFAVVLVLAAGLYTVFLMKLKKSHQASDDETFHKEDITYNEEKEAYSKTIEKRFKTILIYGVDARNNVNLLKNANADTEIILVIDNLTHEMKLVSLHRDMFTERASGGHGKLTDIYAGYGVEESMKTINRTLDLHITEYVAVNWYGLQKVVDLLGGLDLQLSSAEVDYINTRIEYTGPVIGQPVTYLENKGDGVYHLNGTQVVCHCSNRTVGRDDHARAERQRIVLSAILSSAKSKDLKALNSIIDTMLPEISTNIGAADMALLAFSLVGLKTGESSLFPFDYIGQRDYSTSYVYCNTLVTNTAKLHGILYGTADYVPSSAVESVSAFIDGYRAEHP